jgi:putative hemolysin
MAMICFLILSLLSPVFAANPSPALVIHLKGKAIPLTSHPDERLVLNESCYSSKTCQAWEVLAKVSAKSIPKTRGGANPGAVLCKMHEGEIHIEKDERGNERSFCVFRDGSVTGTESLIYRAFKNDRDSISHSR